MPSTPGYPAERQSAQRPASGRVAETFDNLESFTATVAAGTAFLSVANFSGTPDSILINCLTGPIDFRFAFRGEAPGGFVRVSPNVPLDTKARAQFVEARDPAGAGGQIVTITGRYTSRSIDVRQNRPGPSRSAEYLPETAEARQLKTTE